MLITTIDVIYWATSTILWAPYVPLWAGDIIIWAKNVNLWATYFNFRAKDVNSWPPLTSENLKALTVKKVNFLNC
jgi:hypothetical protein